MTRRVSNDPLRDQNGTIRLDYRYVTDGGVLIHMRTRTFRMTESQYERLHAFVTELFESTPELHAKPEEPR